MAARAQRAGAASALLLTFVGCTGAVDDLRVPLDRTGTLVTVSITADGDAEVFALAVSSSTAPYLAVPRRARDRVLATWSDCDLDTLGLTAGLQRVDPTAGLPLPTPSAVRELDPTTGAWVDRDALTPEAAALRIERQVAPPCASISTAPAIELPGTALRVLLPADAPGEVFVGTASGAFSIFDARGRRRPVQLPTSTPHLAGFRDGRGTIWLLGSGGRLSSGTLAGGFTPLPTASFLAPEVRGWLTGAPDGSELFAMDDVGAIGRFADGAWTVLRAGRSPLFSVGGAAWREPGVAVFVGADERVVFVDHGALRVEALDVAPTTVVELPGQGAAIGDASGHLITLRDERWRSLDLHDPHTIRFVAPLERGVVWGDGVGRVGQWHPGFDAVGGCPLTEVGPLTFGLGTALDAGVALFSYAPQRSVGYLYFVSIIPDARPACARLSTEVPGW